MKIDVYLNGEIIKTLDIALMVKEECGYVLLYKLNKEGFKVFVGSIPRNHAVIINEQ